MTVILVPMRQDGGWRDRLWEYCRQQWLENFPDWPIFEGIHAEEEGPFNRSMAINRASAMAHRWLGAPWDTALVIDADTLSDPGAVRRSVEHAERTGHLSIAHNARLMLSEVTTRQIVEGGVNPWAIRRNRATVKKTYYDSISCAVAVRRDVWDAVEGFDEEFVGWGFEDTAFRIAVETLTGHHLHVEQSDCLHLWHASSPEASHFAPTYARNHARKRRYEDAHFQPERVRAILDGRPDPAKDYGQIPRILWRTVPSETTEEVERWWADLGAMHPDWEQRTVREPVDPADFPRTGHLLDLCVAGAQRAGLIRLELLATHGGVYVDSDVCPVRPLEALRWLPGFAAWEDERVVPDAVLGCVPGHPALIACLNEAARLVAGGSRDPWETGPGVTTRLLPGRDDVLLLPPGSFYPVHYKEKQALGSRNHLPWVMLEHRWHHSWDSKKRARRVAPDAPAAQGLDELVESLSDVKLVVCMPWRDSDDSRRREAKAWCRGYWEHAGLRVFEGTGESRAQMCNDAARQALEWVGDDPRAVLLFADADTWAPLEQVVAAAVQADLTGQLVLPYDAYYRQDQVNTRVGLRSAPGRIRTHRYERHGRRAKDHVSGLVAVPARLWRAVGGFDQRFVGWGFEDQVFHLACKVLGGGETHRVEGPAVHWYHKQDPTKRSAPSEEAIALVSAYCSAAGEIPARGRTGRLAAQGVISIASSHPSVEAMESVLARPGGPLSGPAAVL